MATQLEVTQVRSAIGTKPNHRATLRALGLGRIGKSNLLPDRPEIRGMIARVPHLVVVTDRTGPAETGPGETGPAETGPGETGPGETS